MMEPITIISTALALGAAAGLESTADQVIKDAYTGLKSLILNRYNKVSIEHLEEAPNSKARRSVIEEDLLKEGADQDEDLLRNAKSVLDAIQAHAPGTAAVIGVNLEDIKGASLKIQDIIATGTGVNVKGANLTGDIEIRGIRAGSPTENAPN